MTDVTPPSSRFRKARRLVPAAILILAGAGAASWALAGKSPQKIASAAEAPVRPVQVQVVRIEALTQPRLLVGTLRARVVRAITASAALDLIEKGLGLPLDEALKLGTHIAIMESGRIVQFGKPEKIVLKPANDYVKEFVAHMNPLNVLRGRSLMTRREALASRDDMLQLDWTGHNLLALDVAGRPSAARIEGRAGRLVPYSKELDLEKTGEDGRAMVMAAPDRAAAHAGADPSGDRSAGVAGG